MNICIIANGYPNKDNPQYGCFERDQAIALKKLGHQVSILYIDGRMLINAQRKVGICHISDNGLEIYGAYYGPISILKKISFRLHYWMASRLLNRAYSQMVNEKGKPNVLYAHFMYNISYASYLKKKHSVPLVGMEHWSNLNKETLLPIEKYWGNIAYNSADILISVANSLRKQIMLHFNKDSFIVYNMIGEAFLNIQRKEKEERSFRLVSTGSLIHRKGFDVLINALVIASTRLPEWNLTIIGEGVERENLQKQILHNKLQHNINLVGRKNKAEIIDYLSQSDVFILPSRAENFSVAVLEALAAGLPVVATLCGGIRECIDERNGMLVPVDDPEKLAEAIIYLSDNLKKFDNIKIADNCKQRFAPQVIAKQLTDFFESVVKR